MTTAIPTTETLQAERLPALWDRYEALYGQRSKCPNKSWLVRKILAALEAKAQDEAHAAALAADAPQLAQQALVDGTVSSGEEAAELEATLRDQAAQEAQDRSEPGPAPEAPTKPEPAQNATEPTGDDSWSGATTVEQRIDRVRAADNTADLGMLAVLAAAQGDLQARVRREFEAHRKALAKVEALAAADPATVGALKALLGNKRTHKRPGVLAAVRARLQATDPVALATTPTTPLADMSLDDLRATYEAEVGRPTDSEHEGYLIWKIREARKGNITTGAIERGATCETRVVPIRLGEKLLAEVDEAWRREGYPSRVAFIREVLAARVKVA